MLYQKRESSFKEKKLIIAETKLPQNRMQNKEQTYTVFDEENSIQVFTDSSKVFTSHKDLDDPFSVDPIDFVKLPSFTFFRPS
jgi:hypothetical protein